MSDKLLEKDSDLELGTSQELSKLSNELMFKSIKVCMEQVLAKVSDMAEILEALPQELIMDSRMEETN